MGAGLIPTARDARRGFTLLELMLALTLTAIAAGVAGTALFTARRASESVRAQRAQGESELRFRAALRDLLRHAPDAAQVDVPLLQVQSSTEGARLEFLSTGVRPPFGTGTVWRVILTSDSTGLLLRAMPLRAEEPEVPVEYRVPGATALQVEVMEGAGDEPTRGAWRTDWPVPQMRPAAISLQWRAADRTEATPMVVRLAPLGVPRT